MLKLHLWEEGTRIAVGKGANQEAAESLIEVWELLFRGCIQMFHLSLQR